MSGTSRAKDPYQPALDGIRAVAVAAVLVFHGGVACLPGGFLGVDAFFVLSGFLITSLLLAERAPTGRIDLVAFWGRRARRLLPALLLMLLAVVVAAALAAAAAPNSAPVRGDALAALGVRRELADDLPGQRLLRRHRGALAAAAHLVAGHRGAVLPALAAARRRWWRCGGSRRCRAARLCVVGACRLDALAGAPLPPRPTPTGPTTAPTAGRWRCWSARARRTARAAGSPRRPATGGTRCSARWRLPAVVALGWAGHAAGGDPPGCTGAASRLVAARGGGGHRARDPSARARPPPGCSPSPPLVVARAGSRTGCTCGTGRCSCLLTAARTGLTGLAAVRRAVRGDAGRRDPVVPCWWSCRSGLAGCCRAAPGWHRAGGARRHRRGGGGVLSSPCPATRRRCRSIRRPPRRGPARWRCRRARRAGGPGAPARPPARHAAADRPSSATRSPGRSAPTCRRSPGLTVTVRAVQGCGIATAARHPGTRRARTPTIPGCTRGPPGGGAASSADDPDVAVILLDRWELMDRRLDGDYQHVGQPGLRRLPGPASSTWPISIAGSRGAPRGAADRAVHAAGRTARRRAVAGGRPGPGGRLEPAAARGGAADRTGCTVLDLNRLVCPDGRFTWASAASGCAATACTSPRRACNG